MCLRLMKSMFSIVRDGWNECRFQTASRLVTVYVSSCKSCALERELYSTPGILPVSQWSTWKYQTSAAEKTTSAIHTAASVDDAKNVLLQNVPPVTWRSKDRGNSLDGANNGSDGTAWTSVILKENSMLLHPTKYALRSSTWFSMRCSIIADSCLCAIIISSWVQSTSIDLSTSVRLPVSNSDVTTWALAKVNGKNLKSEVAPCVLRKCSDPWCLGTAISLLIPISTFVASFGGQQTGNSIVSRE